MSLASNIISTTNSNKNILPIKRSFYSLNDEKNNFSNKRNFFLNRKKRKKTKNYFCNNLLIKKKQPFIVRRAALPIVATLCAGLIGRFIGGENSDRTKTEVENKLLFNVEINNENNLKSTIKNITQSFYSNILSVMTKNKLNSLNQSNIHINSFANNNEIVIAQNQSNSYYDFDNLNLVEYTKIYKKVKKNVVNDIKNVFENKTINEFNQQFDKKENNSFISQLKGFFKSVDDETTIKNLAESNQFLKNAINNIFETISEEINETTVKLQYESINEFVTKNTSQIDVNAKGKQKNIININTVQGSNIFLKRLVELNISSSIFNDINDSNIIQVSDSLINGLNNMGKQIYDEEKKDESFSSIMVTYLFGVLALGGAFVGSIFLFKKNVAESKKDELTTVSSTNNIKKVKKNYSVGKNSVSFDDKLTVTEFDKNKSGLSIVSQEHLSMGSGNFDKDQTVNEISLDVQHKF
jgi:hypothetical protein